MPFPRKTLALIALLLLVSATAGSLLWLHRRYRIESIAQVGRPLPELTLTDPDGRRVGFDRYAGSRLLAVFVDLECSLCREQFQVLEELHEKGEANGVAVVVVVRRNVVLPVDLPQISDYPFPVWIDPERQARRKLGATGVPAFFLLDERGILRKKAVGYQALDEVEKLIGSMDGA